MSLHLYVDRRKTMITELTENTATERSRTKFDYSYLPAENDLRRSFGKDTISLSAVEFDDGRHWLADRVEGVDLEQLILRHLGADRLIILLQIKYEAEQGALGLVADLRRNLARLARLSQVWK